MTNTQAVGVAVEACGLCSASGRVPLDWDGPMPSDLVAHAGLVSAGKQVVQGAGIKLVQLRPMPLVSSWSPVAFRGSSTTDP